MAAPVEAPQLEAEVAVSVKLEEPDFSSSNWYFSREEIEKYSPSRKDGIDLKKETYYRRSYCTYLQDLGMRLKVPQVTIATAIVFCHRFFLRQSHARNDRQMIATVCMFLAGKVEETPRHLDEVIKVSYAIRFKKDPNAAEKIKKKEVLAHQKELMLVGERLVLSTLGFDLNIYHPYKPLVAAIKKFKVSQNTLAQVAWNFVNDGLRTSLCLQFKPHHIAAGAIFLAAKFLKIKLPCDGEKAWWQEFEVTPRQLEVVSNQMLELYEQNRPVPGSKSSDPSASGPSKGTNNNVQPSSNGEALEEPNGDPAGGDVEDSKKTSAVSEEMVLSPSVNGSQVELKKEVEDALPPKAPAPHLDGQIKAGNVASTSEPLEEHKGQGWEAVDEVNKDKLKAAVEKRRRSRGEASEVKLKEEVTDEEMLERQLESGVEAAVEVERSSKQEAVDEPKPKQAKVENGYRRDDRGRSEEPKKDDRGKLEEGRKDDGKRQASKREEVDSGAKRKRSEEDYASDKNTKEERVVEEGELPPPTSSGGHDRSPSAKRSSPQDRRRDYGREQAPYPPRRDAFSDGKLQHSSRESSYRHHSSSREYAGGSSSYHHHHYAYQQQQQQQQPRDAEWHRSREGWSERDNKKARYEHK